MAQLTQAYSNQITRYSIFLYTDNGQTIYLGDTVEFGYTIQRDKMPVPVLGNKNQVTIVRKGRLATGYFTRFLENGVDMQRLLVEKAENDTNFRTDTAVTELIKRSFTADDVQNDSRILQQFNLSFKDAQGATQDVTDATLIRRRGLRLGDFENINILVVGTPEIVDPDNAVSNGLSGDDADYIPDKLMVARFRDCVFQGESINISIDNPNIIEQVSFISTQATFYNKIIELD